MNIEKEITDLKARLAALEPKPEPKLPTEIGSHVRAGDGSVFFVKMDNSTRPWIGSDTQWATDKEVLAYYASHGGFQVGRVVWGAE